jgi:hypothetical protein
LEQEEPLQNLKPILMIAGFVVLAVWVVVMVFSLALSFLGFSVSEILISPEFMAAGCSFSFLYSNLLFGQKEKGEKVGLILSILGLIIGANTLSLGAFAIMITMPNFFTYLCPIIGTALIFLNVKQIRAHFEIYSQKSW